MTKLALILITIMCIMLAVEARETKIFLTVVAAHIAAHDAETVRLEDVRRRDDAILDRFMDGNWDRNKCVMFWPTELLADGTDRYSIELVECDRYK